MIRRLSFTALCIAARIAAAQTVPATINYQGRLTDNTPAQAPLNATVNMTFEIWDAPSGGTRLWLEPNSGATAITVSGGIFNVLLGASAGGSSVPIPASVFTSGTTSRYLQIIVNGETLTPRQAISAAGYANQAQHAALAVNATAAITATNATQLGGVAAGGYQLATVQNCGAGQFVNAISNGSAGCATPATGTLNPPVTLAGSNAAPLLTVSQSGAGDGVVGENLTTNPNVTGVYGRIANTGAGPGSVGVHGDNAGTGPDGIGVFGSHAGGGSGVYGTSVNGWGVNGASTNGTGVYGTSVTGIAVDGEQSTTTGVTYAVVGQNRSSAGVGVYGAARSATIAAGSNTFGVWGENLGANGLAIGVYGDSINSTSGIGVYGTGGEYGIYGTSTASTGLTYGVVGITTSTTSQAAGVYGANYAATGLSVGVSGYASSPTGTGVVGKGTSTGGFFEAFSTAGSGNAGVVGQSDATSGLTYGVEGTAASSSGFGVYGGNTSGTAIYGYSSGTGDGVTGVSTGHNGVAGLTASTGDSGIYGENTGLGRAAFFRNVNASSSAATLATFASNPGPGGIFQLSNTGNASTALTGTTNGTGDGVRGENTSSSATRVNGVHGVVANTANSNSAAVFGENLTGLFGYGVFGTHGGSGIGIGGYSVSGDGVLGSTQSGNAGRFLGDVVVTGRIEVDTLGTGGATSLCINGFNRLSTCSSSLRYKTDLQPFTGGLNILERLQPITFTWKTQPLRDLGLGAEAVAAVEPLLVTRNAAGEIEGVKYDRINIVLINAVREQQAQIAAERERSAKQEIEIEALKKLVCADHPDAEVCKPRS